MRKGSFSQDYVPLCNFRFMIEGLLELIATEVSGLSHSIETVEFEDKVVYSLGRKSSLEFTVTVPIHENVQMGIMELWWLASQDPMEIGHKHNATLLAHSVFANITSVYLIIGMFPCGRKYPDFKKSSAEMAEEIWTFKADDLQVIL